MPSLISKKPLAIFSSRRTLLSAAAVLAISVQAGCGGTPAPQQQQQQQQPPPPVTVPPAALSYDTNPAVYHLGTAIAANAPHSSGGAVASYSVTPALPAGLTLDATTGVLSGTPTAITAQASYIVTAANSGGSAACTLAITVADAPPAQLAYGMPQATYTKGVAIPANAPTSAGGAVTSYAVSPGLPAGLSIDSATGVISGTPTEVTASFSYTVTASNTGGSTTARVQIAVKDVAPGGLTYAANPVTYYLNNAITPNTPTSAGGVATTYFVEPPLPSGLLLDSATGIISGTPLVTGQGSYTVTASNSGGSATCSLALTIIAKPPAGLTYATNPVVATKGVAMTPDVPSSTGGPIVSYGVSPQLPAGLSFDPATGIVSGTPAAITPAATYVVTATNTGGTTTANLILSVQDQAPRTLVYATNPSSYTLNIAIQPNVPSNTGGVILGYSVSPALPAGLVLDPSTGIISGTPTSLAPQATYVITGSNATGGTTCNFVTSVVPDPIPPPDAPVVSTVTFATAGKAGYQASTQDQGTANGMSYLWTVTNGSITGGQGTPAITFTAGTVGTLVAQVKVTNLSGSATGSAQASVQPAPAAPIFSQDQVLTGSKGVLASVPPQSGMTYQWSISGGGAGVISAGATTNVATYSVGSLPGTYQLSVTVQNLAGDQVTGSRTQSVVSKAFLPDVHTAPQRVQHSITALLDGRLLVAGGMDATWVTASAMLYDPYSNTWARVGSMTDGRAGHTATLLTDGRVLVTGGEGSDANLTPLHTTELYDPATQTWSAGGDLSVERQDHTATRLADGRVLVAGGIPILTDTSFSYLNTAEIYNPATNSWSDGGTMSLVRADHSATLLPDGRVVLIGGGSQQGSAGWQRTIDIFNPQTLSWTAGTNMIASRISHTADLLPSGKVLVAGGNGSASPSSALLFDPTGNGGKGAWSNAASMTNGRYQHQSAVLAGGKVLVVAGHDGTQSGQELSTAELYDPAANTWSSAGSLNYSTYNHGVALLPGGKVYAFGGQNSSGGGTLHSSNGQIYDPAQNLWSAAGGMSFPRYTHTTTTLSDGTLLTAGGTGTKGSTATAEIFDPVAGAWSLPGSMISPRAQHAASLLGNGTVLVTGGFGGSILTSAEIYTPPTRTWTATAAMAVARIEHTSTTLADGRVLVAGGRSTVSSTPVNASAAIYDPATSSWIAVPDMSTARYGHQAILLANGKVLVSGGRNGNTFINTAEIFDPATNTWSGAAPMNLARYAHTSTLLGNRVLVTGGQTDSNDLTATAEIYDPSADTWTGVASMSVPRNFHTGTLLANQQVLVAGGRGGPFGPTLDTAELYDPVANTWTSVSSLAGGARYNHTAAALADGTVVLIGGQYSSMPEVWKP
jgi:N-acetylneuraminic acid mutarotase